MSSKVKLWLNLTAIVLVFILITVTVGALLTKRSLFLTVPDPHSAVENLNMEIKGKVKGENFFIISYVNGNPTTTYFDNNGNPTTTPNTIEKMTFTHDDPVVEFDMDFENSSKELLYIKVSGIYLDTVKYPNNPRFSTTAFVDDVGRAFHMENLTGTIFFEIESPSNDDLTPNKEDGSIVSLSLKYTLESPYNRNINNETQNLLISINTEPF